jgi:opacity protein-like surface antigen
MGKIKCVVLLVLLCISSVLFADEPAPASGWYVRFDAGRSNARDPKLKIPDGPLPADLGSSPIYGGGLGYSLVPGLRADLTITYRSGFQQVSGFPAMPQGNADFRSLATLLSFYMDVLSSERVSPYFGFGFGFARNDLGRITITNPDGSLLGTIDGKTKTGYAWQFCAGGAFQLTNNFLLDAGYHYLSAGDYESKDLLVFTDGISVSAKDQAKFRSHEFILSLQYTF